MELSNRIVLAPLTRFRASRDHVPSVTLAGEYYAQRGSIPGTLLISEATNISRKATGYFHTPGVFSNEQLLEWKKITDRVHEAGSFIFCQLWATGRVASPEYASEHNQSIVSASPIPEHAGNPPPRALEEAEVWEWVREFATAARLAVEVGGFDGVEIHGANGYLVGKFFFFGFVQISDYFSTESRATRLYFLAH